MAKRTLYAIPAVLIVVIIIFTLTRVLPGDPARVYAGEQADEATIQQVREEMGLDKSLADQFVLYVRGLLRGDLGYAWHSNQNVTEGFAARLPASLELALVSILIALIIGVPLGVLSATHKNSPLDHGARVFSLVGASMPSFWLGLMLILMFYVNLHVAAAPIGRIGKGINPPTAMTGFYLLDSLLSGDLIALKSSLHQILLPAVTLCMSSLAVIARMTRASMLEVLNQDFVRTAYAKGIKERAVVYRHALSNALIPILTVLGSQFGYLLGYSVVVETIFSWPGIGSYVTESILVTDYAPIQAFALMSACVYVVINLILDVLYRLVDPRVQYE